MKDLIQKQKIDTQNNIFKISFRTKSLWFVFRRETRRIHFQYPSHDDHFRRETPRNFAAKRREISLRNFSFFSLFLREIVNLPFAFFTFRREKCAFYFALTVAVGEEYEI